MKKSIIAGCILLLVVYACIKTEPVSPDPQITFKSFELTDAYDSLGNKIKVGTLVFSFIDGDADIGIETEIDTTQSLQYNYNVFLYPYKKVDGKYIKIDIDTAYNSLVPPPFYRITYDPKLDRVGQNKTIKGTISIDIPYVVIPNYDTLKYEFYIIDRAMNKSNVESTTDIAFK